MMEELLIHGLTAFSTIIATLIPAYLLHFREVRKYKVEIKQHQLRGDVLDRILDITLLEDIKNSTKILFKETKIDRFLILIAVNGKTKFNTVSVIFEQHKNSTSSAIARYKNLSVDTEYKDLLTEVEKFGFIILSTDTMKEGLLKDIYEVEEVHHSEIRHLARQPLDSENDCLVFCSSATHLKAKFNKKDLLSIQTQIDSVIKPTIKKMLT